MQGPALTNAHIVPDVVDHVNLEDAVSMRVQYGDRIVTTGNELRPSEMGSGLGTASIYRTPWANCPRVGWWQIGFPCEARSERHRGCIAPLQHGSQASNCCDTVDTSLRGTRTEPRCTCCLTAM